MPLLACVAALVLSACSSGWRAPLETRDSPQSPRDEARRPGPADTHYRVRRGDTLYAIAWRIDRDFREIARWNGIRSPYTIYEDQVLRLRPPRSHGGQKPRVATTAPPRPAVASPPVASAPRPPPAAPRNSEPASSQATPQGRPEPQTATTSANMPSSGALSWAWPVQGAVKSRFKDQDPLRKGIKLSGTPGDPVRATESGKVVYSGSGLIGYGRLIIVMHNDKYLSAYGHNRKLLAAQGEQVTKGQKIAELGTSNDGTPLLHFEIRRDGRPVDPLALLPRR